MMGFLLMASLQLSLSTTHAIAKKATVVTALTAYISYSHPHQEPGANPQSGLCRMGQVTNQPRTDFKTA